MAFLDVTDLEPFLPQLDGGLAQAMIDDAEAMAVLAAPCIAQDGFDSHAAVKAILRGAVVRWVEAGSGAVQSQSAGPFGMTIDTRQQRRGMFWPSEISQLQRLCATSTGSAFSIDQVPVRDPNDIWLRPDLWFQWVWPVPPDAP